MGLRQVAGLGVISLIWGASFLFIRVLVDADMGAAGVSGGRTAFGSLVMLPAAVFFRKQFPRSPRLWLGICTLGVFNFALPWTLLSVAEQQISSGTASIGNSAMPLWTALFAAILISSEKLTKTQLVGLMVGFLGVVTLMGRDADAPGVEILKGVPLVVAATICYALSSVIIRRWLGAVPPIALSIGQIGTAAVVLAPLALATGAWSGVDMGANEWLSLVLLGVGGSGVAVVLYMWLIGQVGAVKASVVTYLMPPVGIFLGWLFLDESVGWWMIGGVALILAGVAIVQGVPVRRLLGGGPRGGGVPEPVVAPGGGE